MSGVAANVGAYVGCCRLPAVRGNKGDTCWRCPALHVAHASHLPTNRLRLRLQLPPTHTSTSDAGPRAAQAQLAAVRAAVAQLHGGTHAHHGGDCAFTCYEVLVCLHGRRNWFAPQRQRCLAVAVGRCLGCSLLSSHSARYSLLHDFTASLPPRSSSPSSSAR